MNNIVAGKEYGVMGCNAYTPPAESKTPYGSWSKVKYILFRKIDPKLFKFFPAQIRLTLNTEDVSPSRAFYLVSISHFATISPFTYMGNTIVTVPSHTLSNSTGITRWKKNRIF